jgi:hypothetical protein
MVCVCVCVCVCLRERVRSSLCVCLSVSIESHHSPSIIIIIIIIVVGRYIIIYYGHAAKQDSNAFLLFFCGASTGRLKGANFHGSLYRTIDDGRGAQTAPYSRRCTKNKKKFNKNRTYNIYSYAYTT